ncbi:MAG: 5'/3'-nucleotidase SurE, partial [Treponema sp.]|nr:5'/3'-nucleotidase SurE [Treponema sp.]
MRLLLTNDDGAASPGILLLAEAMRRAGHRVFMVAPQSDSSGISHAVTFFKGERKLAEIGRDAYALEGTPADCVIVALRGGIPELDMNSGQ